MSIKEQIQDFVKLGQKSLNIPMTPIREVEEALTEIGFDELALSGGETNGWEIDFWYQFKSKQYGDYTLSGSLHYGDFNLTKK